MKKFLSIFALMTLVAVAGCGNKKKNKSVVAQENIVAEQSISTIEKTSANDKKEDYIIA